MVHPPGIERGGSGRVVRAAGQATKRNPSLPSSVEKTVDSFALEIFCLTQIAYGPVFWYNDVILIFSTEKRAGERLLALWLAARALYPEPLGPTPEKNFQNLPQKLHMVVGHYLRIQV